MPEKCNSSDVQCVTESILFGSLCSFALLMTVTVAMKALCTKCVCDALDVDCTNDITIASSSFTNAAIYERITKIQIENARACAFIRICVSG